MSPGEKPVWACAGGVCNYQGKMSDDTAGHRIRYEEKVTSKLA